MRKSYTQRNYQASLINDVSKLHLKVKQLTGDLEIEKGLKREAVRDLNRAKQTIKKLAEKLNATQRN